MCTRAIVITVALLLLTTAAAQSHAAPEPAYVAIIIDVRPVPERVLTTHARQCPAFRALAHDGVSVLRITPDAQQTAEGVTSLLTYEDTHFMRAGAARHGAEQLWLLLPRSGPLRDHAHGGRLFSADLQHAPFKRLLERFGSPMSLTDPEVRWIREFRGRFGRPPTGGEVSLARLLAGSGTESDRNDIVLHRLTQLFRQREARCAVAVLGMSESLEPPTGSPEENAVRLDRSLGALRSVLTEEPYRNRTFLAYVALPSAQSGCEGYAVCAGPRCRRGMVVSGPFTQASVRTLLFLGAGLDSDDAAVQQLPPEILRR